MSTNRSGKEADFELIKNADRVTEELNDLERDRPVLYDKRAAFSFRNKHIFNNLIDNLDSFGKRAY